MPLYGYKCNCGIEQEEFFKIADRAGHIPCICGGKARRQVTCKIARDEPVWLGEAVNHAVNHGSDVRKPENRTEFNKYLKDNNIEHVG